MQYYSTSLPTGHFVVLRAAAFGKLITFEAAIDLEMSHR